MRKSLKLLVSAAIIGVPLAALGLSQGAQAQDKVTTLRVADSFPVGHFISERGTKPWMDEVTKRTNGRIKFEYFPAQQLGKAQDLLNLTQSGVADIGYVGMSYVSDKMPFSSVAQLPGSFTTACEGTTAYWKLVKGETMQKNEFAPNKVRAIFAIVLEPYQFYTTTKQVKTVEDVKGLKLRSTGGAMDIFARKIGAIPVRIPAPEARESLSRGTLDGLIFPNESVMSYDLQSFVKFGTKGGNFGSFVASYVISDAVFNKLPKDVQKIITETGDTTTANMCKVVDHSVEEAQAKLAAAGVQYHTLTAAERKPFDDVSDEVARDWAETLDKRGKPGTQVLKEFRAALAEVRGKK
ncbi:TRAP transporter substrate-binding protein DctP [Ferrovibrio sp.]|uniref:TRAP transporter substrate-binding protein n=1 Tax=Ferrovibrio sp. TaxID=1917215 RepID=UPI003D29EB63